MSIVAPAAGRRVFVPLMLLCLLWSACTQAHARDDAADLRTMMAGERARPLPPQISRHVFLQRASISSTMLSPDGRAVAWLQERGTQREVWIRDTHGGAPRRLLAHTTAQQLDWTRDARWLLLSSARDVHALATAGQTGSGLVTRLGGLDRVEWLDIDASRPASLLVLEQVNRLSPTQSEWHLVRVDIHGRREIVRRDRQRITAAALDQRGELAWLQRLEGGQLVIHHVQNGSLRAVLHCGPTQRCALRGTAADGRAWLRTDMQGDLSRLALLSPGGKLTTVHADPQQIADVDAITMDPVHRQPRFIAYRSSTAHTHALSMDDAAHLATIQRALPGRDVAIQPGDGAGARWLITATASDQAETRWHLYDPVARTLAFLQDDAPLDRRSGKPITPPQPASLARALPVSWNASDGMRLHGFVWLPPGRDSARVPLVVMPHGGPWNHRKPEYRAQVQLLANRGYAVFEPNFRASTGHGRDYVLAARGDFGNGRVQQDIVEGTRWLLANGVGDPARVGIAGASFGGYSALLGVTFDPALFKVAVAFVPPPDFGWVLRWVLRTPEALDIGSALPLQEWLAAQALDVDDARVMTRLHAQSPLANVERLQRPLLLVAGGEDRRVGIAGVIEYAARLKLVGKDATLLVDEDAGHGGSSPLASEAQMYLMEHMLHRHLGGPAPAPADAGLRAYLRTHLRLTGASAPRLDLATGKQ